MLQALAPLAILMAFGQVQSTDRGLDAVHKPAPNPISWELEIDFLDPRRIEVQLPGQTETELRLPSEIKVEAVDALRDEVNQIFERKVVRFR